MGICHGTGRVPDENGAKVEIVKGFNGRNYAYKVGALEPIGEGDTPAEAFADAQRAHKANTAG